MKEVLKKPAKAKEAESLYKALKAGNGSFREQFRAAMAMCIA